MQTVNSPLFFVRPSRSSSCVYGRPSWTSVNTWRGEGGGRVHVKTKMAACSGKRSILMILRKNGNAITDCLNIILGTKSNNLGQFHYLHWPTNYQKRNYRKAKIGHACANRNLSGLHAGKLKIKKAPQHFSSYLNCQSVGRCDSQCLHIAFITISRLWFYQQNRSSLFAL